MSDKATSKIKINCKKCQCFCADKIEKLSSILHILLVLLTFFIFTQVVALCYVYFQLSNNQDINIKLFHYINFFWNLSPTDYITIDSIRTNSDEIIDNITFLLNAAIAVSSVLLSLLTFISYLRRSIKLKKTSCFKKSEIFKNGVDDIKIMINHFKHADFIAVYSKNFTWLDDNDDIRNILEKMAEFGKVKLVTCEKENVVRDKLQKCSDVLKNTISQKVGLPIQPALRFSYIERDNTQILLYRQKEDDHTYVITVKETNESKYLLHTISQIVKI
jgi:hypothetical protein